MHKLYLLRSTLNIRPGLLSKLLNITAHTYLLYEKEILSIPPEVAKMLSIIFCVNFDTIYGNRTITEDELIGLKKISCLNDEDKIKILATRILPNGEELNYRSIRKMKLKIQKELE